MVDNYKERDFDEIQNILKSRSVYVTEEAACATFQLINLYREALQSSRYNEEKWLEARAQAEAFRELLLELYKENQS